jgi:putative transcriptional regulator
MLVYKFDVLEALKEAGYNSTRLRRENVFGQSTITCLRNNEIVNTKTIDTLCKLLDMQPGNIIKYIPDSEEEQQKKSRKTSSK